MTIWYRIDLPFACFAVSVDHRGVVAVVPPIARWAIGRQLDVLAHYARRKGGTVVPLAPQEKKHV